MNITKQEANAALLAIDATLRAHGAAALGNADAAMGWITLAPKLSEVVNAPEEEPESDRDSDK